LERACQPVGLEITLFVDKVRTEREREAKAPKSPGVIIEKYRRKIMNTKKRRPIGPLEDRREKCVTGNLAAS